MPATAEPAAEAAPQELIPQTPVPESEYDDLDALGMEDGGTEPVQSEPAVARDSSGRFAKREQPVAETTDESAAIIDAPVEQEPPAEPAEQDEFDADLLSRAESDYGISADEARAFGSRDLLGRAMAASDRRAAQWGLSQVETQRQPEPAPRENQNGHANGQTNGHVQPPAEQPTPQQIQAAIEKFKLELDPNDGWDEVTIKTLNGFNDHYHGALSQLEQQNQMLAQALLMQHEQLQQITGQSQAEVEARFERDMDTWFDSRGDEWKDEFGTGPARDLPENSPQLANRQKLIRQMKGLAVASGKPVTPEGLPQLRDRAFGSLYYQQIHSRARQQLTSQVTKRSAQTVARPSGSNRPVPGDQAARQFVSGFLQARAAADEDEDYGL